MNLWGGRGRGRDYTQAPTTPIGSRLRESCLGVRMSGVPHPSSSVSLESSGMEVRVNDSSSLLQASFSNRPQHPWQPSPDNQPQPWQPRRKVTTPPLLTPANIMGLGEEEVGGGDGERERE